MHSGSFMFMKILLIEDDKDIVSVLQRNFEEDNHSVEVALDGDDGAYMATTNDYDIIILDWMMPKKDGIEVISYIRQKSVQTPVIMLTAKADIEDKVQGLSVGCDDYLAKPFSFRELEARVQALYRRNALSVQTNIIEFDDIYIDIDKKSVLKAGKEVLLSSKEYSLFVYLLQHKNSYVTKGQIENNLWTNEEFVNSNVIEVTIYNIRKKIGKKYIKNYRGLGYKIETK